MSLIFLSSDLSPKAKEYIKSNILNFDGYVTSNQDNADLIVCNNICLLQPSTILIPRISFICFRSMIEQDINPFAFQYKSKILANLFFMNKTFMFYETSLQKIQQCTKIIELMCGTVKKEDADYCLTEKQDEPHLKQLISIAWIFALQHSSYYIPPDSYIIAKKIQKSHTKKRTKKSTFKGQLQIYCSDKPECPSFPRITSQRSQNHSQSIKTAQKGELTIFVGSSNKKASQIEKNVFSQKLMRPAITIKKTQNKISNTQIIKFLNRDHQNRMQHVDLSQFCDDSYDNTIKNPQKIESDNMNNAVCTPKEEIGVDFIDQLTSFSQVINSDQEDEFENDVHYEMNKAISETDSEITFSQDPILLAFS